MARGGAGPAGTLREEAEPAGASTVSGDHSSQPLAAEEELGDNWVTWDFIICLYCFVCSLFCFYQLRYVYFFFF